MPQLEQHWPALQAAFEQVLGEISGREWKAQEIASLSTTEGLSAIRLEVAKMPKLGGLTLIFSPQIAAELATLLTGEQLAQTDEAVIELMRQVAGRMEDVLRAAMELQACSIVLRWCPQAPEPSSAFAMRPAAEGQNALEFGVAFDALPEGALADAMEDWSAFHDVAIDVRLRFGTRELSLAEILEFSPGDVIELQQRLEEPADLLLGNRVFARGDVVLIDGHYGLRVTELVARSMA